MRYEPVNGWIIGRSAISKITKDAVITLPGAPKGVTRHYLIDHVSPEAAKAGYAVGDLVIAHHVFDLVLWGTHRVLFKVEEVITFVRDIPLDEFVGIDGGPIEEPKAA